MIEWPKNQRMLTAPADVGGEGAERGGWGKNKEYTTAVILHELALSKGCKPLVSFLYWM